MLFARLSAAGPVTHAYLGERFCAACTEYDGEECKLFILGTLFPDIRYLGTVDRKSTHYETMTLTGVLEEKSPFMAGVKFHSYVDIERAVFVKESGAMGLVPEEVEGRFRHSFLKLVEDQIVFEKEDWDLCCLYLEENPPEEMELGVDYGTARRWHALLTLFFKSSPATAVRLIGMVDSRLAKVSGTDPAELSGRLLSASSEPSFVDYTASLIGHFDDLFQSTRSQGPSTGRERDGTSPPPWRKEAPS